MWYYWFEDSERGPVGWDEVKRLVATRVITAATKVRRANQTEWAEAGSTGLAPYLRIAGSSEVPTGSMGVVSETKPHVVDIEGYERLAGWVRLTLAAVGLLAVVAILLTLKEIRVVSSAAYGNRIERREALEPLAAVEDAQARMAAIQLVVGLLSLTLFLVWLHRSGRNVRTLGATGLEFTPGWLVGWYFVPVLNLWRPFQGMVELWKASANPGAWRQEEAPRSVSVWWGLWLLAGLIGFLLLRLSRQAESPEIVLVASYVSLASDAVTVPQVAFWARVVGGITRLQGRPR